ncbi:hypothetical protein ACOMHN_025635 [Nucella lapillus]
MAAKTKQRCPDCDLECERLEQHRCKAIAPRPPGRVTDDNSSENATKTKTRGKQSCPNRGRDLERLDRHKCSAVASLSSAEAGSQLNPTRSSASTTSKEQTAGNAAKKRTKKKQPAGDVSSFGDACGGSSLGNTTPANERNAISQEEATVNSSEGDWGEESSGNQLDEDTVPREPSRQSTRPDDRGARSKVKSATSTEEGDNHVYQQCEKSFKRLSQHKCKAVTLPPPAPKDTPQPPAPAQDCRGYRPMIDTSALEEKAQMVMEILQLLPSSHPNSEATSFFEDEVKVKRPEIKDVSFAFNRFRNKFKLQLEESTDISWDILNSGSSYDGTKVTRADEVDCMFIPHLPSQWLKISLDKAPPGFCFLEVTSAVSRDNPLGLFLLDLCDGKRLSSQQFRTKTFEIFKKTVEDERHAEVDPDAKQDSPSYAVLLKAIPSANGKPGLDPVSIDLVPALKIDGLPPGCDFNLRHLPEQVRDTIRKEGCQVIPKKCPDGGYDEVSHLLWRFSFSRAEKELTKYADSKVRNDAMAQGQEAQTSKPTCRKVVLRCLKRSLEIFKELDNSRTTKLNPKMCQLRNVVGFLKEQGGYEGLKVEKFTTFQIRTLLWTEFYVTCPGTEQWGMSSRRTCLIRSLLQLKKMVSGQMRVTHFFVPGMEIMAEVSQREREFLYIMFHIAKEIF